MLKNLTIKHKQRGDTIVEVLIAIAIVSLVLTGAYAIARQSSNGIRTAQERGEALKIAESQVEYLRNAANTNSGSLTNPPQNQLFCYNDNGERKDFTAVSAPIPSIEDDIFSNYHAECQNKSNLYNVSVEHHISSFSFTFRVRWDGLQGRRNEVQLFYRPNIGVFAPPAGPSGPIADFGNLFITSPEISFRCKPLQPSVPEIMISGVSSVFPIGSQQSHIEIQVVGGPIGAAGSYWETYRSGVILAETHFNPPESLTDMNAARDMPVGRTFRVTVTHPTGDPAGYAQEDVTILACPIGGGGGGPGPVTPPPSNYTITFRNSASGGTPPYTCSWNLGNGTSSAACQPGQSFTWTYPTLPQTTYPVSLRITDALGLQATINRSVTVPN